MSEETAMRPLQQRKFVGVIVLGALALAGCLAAEAPSTDNEEQIRQKEREDEAKSPEGQKKFEREVSGKILLNPEWVAQAKQDGVEGRDLGTFVSDKGHGFVLRVRFPAVLKTVEQNNGKTVIASGRVEVNGKYFVLREITTSQGAGPGRRKLGGL
jgi:hypothetical protein